MSDNGRVYDKAVLDWSPDDVGHWLRDNGFARYVDLLCMQHQIDGAALLATTESDLKQSPIEIKVLGDVKRLCIRIRKLQMENRDAMRDLALGQVERQDR